MRRLNPPLTSTHLSIKDSSFLRVNNEEYADVYLHGKWVQSTILNVDILATNRRKYVTIYSTGFARSITNLFQWAIGSCYRVKEIKMYQGSYD